MILTGDVQYSILSKPFRMFEEEATL